MFFRWSFGVVLWEIFSCGRVPYAEHDVSDIRALVSWLRKGNRMEKPYLAPLELYG